MAAGAAYPLLRVGCMRIVSLLPSATEILFAIGAGPDVVGVTFECDFPEQARQATIVSTSAMPEGLTPAQIDAYVVGAMQRGEDLYHLNAGALAGLDADLVVTQDLCAVCAVDVSVVEDALTHLGCRAEVLTIDPHTLEDVFDSIAGLGAATGHAEEAAALVSDQRERLATVQRRVAEALTVRSRPKVMVLEWTDPPYAPGHWIPEMVEVAGGVAVLGRTGDKSVRVEWETVNAADPDVIIVAPCGLDRAQSEVIKDELVANGVLPVGIPVYAVDANASWARPGTRLVDGIEELADLLHS